MFLVLVRPAEGKILPSHLFLNLNSDRADYAPCKQAAPAGGAY
ncbi:hypothetical protein [uncultured Campylobacter sp.]|nr:hypothetical protein [uncultured Campylobacter sp.]